MATTTLLSDGNLVTTTPVQGGFVAQISRPDGALVGPAFTLTQAFLGFYGVAAVTPLVTGGYLLESRFDGALLPAATYAFTAFDAGGNVLSGPASLNDQPGGARFGSPASALALPDGGYAIAWLGPDGGAGASLAYVREYAASGLPVSGPVVLGAASAVPVLSALDAGRYAATWPSLQGSPQQQTFVEHDPPLTGLPGQPAQTFAPLPPNALTPSGSSIALSASAGWTTAAVLSNHALAVVGAVDGGYGSHAGAEQVYQSSGALVASGALGGYAAAGQALIPMIRPLDGGYYQVGYVGSSDYEIDNAAGQRVFSHNVYTPPAASFTALPGGGYITTNGPGSPFGLFSASGANLAWVALPADAVGAPTVHGLTGGGFVFDYPAVGHFDVFDAAGTQISQGYLNAAASGFATGFTALAGGGFAEAWLSPDGGQNGLATSLRFEAFDSAGAAVTAVLTIGQDLDPWHTSFKLQAHADGSVAVLWSQGGGTWGAEYAHGVISAPHASGVAQSLADMNEITLSTGAVGLAWLQGGDAWAEIFDTETGSVSRVDLGSATGDLGSVHALATADGGMAVSWHSGATVMVTTLSASGHASAATPLPGDLLGVDAQGRALVVSGDSQHPVLDHYTLGSELFWAA